MQHAYSRYKTNEMRLYNIIHLTRKHLFNITLVPMQTEHYIHANTGIATTVIYLFKINILDSLKQRFHLQQLSLKHTYERGNDA